METQTYNLATIILWTMTLIAGISTAIIYYLQLREMQRGVRNQNQAWLIQYLQSNEVRRARNVVLTDLKSKPYAQGNGWTDMEKEDAATACAAYGVAGVLIELNRVDADVIVDNWGPSIKMVCEICHDLIEQRRNASGANYWLALLQLNERVRLRQI
jgi:hypothetical protein